MKDEPMHVKVFAIFYSLFFINIRLHGCCRTPLVSRFPSFASRSTPLHQNVIPPFPSCFSFLPISFPRSTFFRTFSPPRPLPHNPFPVARPILPSYMLFFPVPPSFPPLVRGSRPLCYFVAMACSFSSILLTTSH